MSSVLRSVVLLQQFIANGTNRIQKIEIPQPSHPLLFTVELSYHLLHLPTDPLPRGHTYKNLHINMGTSAMIGPMQQQSMSPRIFLVKNGIIQNLQDGVLLVPPSSWFLPSTSIGKIMFILKEIFKLKRMGR